MKEKVNNSSTMKNKISKIIWAFSFICSICGLIYYSYGVFQKFNSEPDFSVRVIQKAMREIPFPALTICSPLFARKNFANYIEVERKLSEGMRLDLTTSEKEILNANYQVCNPVYDHKIKKLFNVSISKTFVKILRNSSMEVNELLILCALKSKVEGCDKFFRRTLTHKGLCYSYNMQGLKNVFTSVISDDFKSETIEDEQQHTLNWTLDNGFIKSHPDLNVPSRAVKENEFGAYLALSKNDSLNICPMFGKVFTFFLHLPNEIPTFFHTENYFAFNHHKGVVLTANSYTTVKSLRKFSPTTRGCFFQNERKLKFFASYTKNHCDFECVTNYTLATCGCVQYSMPRDKMTKVCEIDQMQCYLDAITQWPSDDDHIACGCLPACNNIEYSVRYEKETVLDFVKLTVNKQHQPNE